MTTSDFERQKCFSLYSVYINENDAIDISIRVSIKNSIFDDYECKLSFISWEHKL